MANLKSRRRVIRVIVAVVLLVVASVTIVSFTSKRSADSPSSNSGSAPSTGPSHQSTSNLVPQSVSSLATLIHSSNVSVTWNERPDGQFGYLNFTQAPWVLISSDYGLSCEAPLVKYGSGWVEISTELIQAACPTVKGSSVTVPFNTVQKTDYKQWANAWNGVAGANPQYKTPVQIRTAIPPKVPASNLLECTSTISNWKSLFQSVEPMSWWLNQASWPNAFVAYMNQKFSKFRIEIPFEPISNFWFDLTPSVTANAKSLCFGAVVLKLPINQIPGAYLPKGLLTSGGENASGGNQSTTTIQSSSGGGSTSGKPGGSTTTTVPSVEVPAVVLSSLSNAKLALEAAGFKVGKVGIEQDSNMCSQSYSFSGQVTSITVENNHSNNSYAPVGSVVDLTVCP